MQWSMETHPRAAVERARVVQILLWTLQRTDDTFGM